MRIRHLVVALSLLVAAAAARTQPIPDAPRTREVPFEFVSAEVARFPKPLRFGAGTKAIALKDALLVKVRVRTLAYEQLPPDIEPYLYVGSRELRTFETKADRSGNRLTITYYTTDLRPLTAGAPMVITVEHGRPVHEPEHYAQRRDLPRFQRSWMRGQR